MRRDWIAFTGIGLACVVVWGLLFFVFFLSDDQDVDSIAVNEDTGVYDQGDKFSQEEEGANDSSSKTSNQETEETVSSIDEEVARFNEEDNHELSSIDSLIDYEDNQKLTLENIRERGIHIGDFDHIAPNSIISIDDVLKEIYGEEF